MKNNYHYASVAEALDELNENGFTYDFNLHEDDIEKNPHSFEIVHIYRYEGNSNPDDESIVFGIKSKSGKKGVFVAGFAANSTSKAAEILIKLNIAGRNK
ncbi:hypothetical protein H4V97_000390 [Flavobacterium sp. CG_23.5]|uniref:hypothetical protein n=1 Tax=unclassified Flavobacterium TaxID=196869 RepID=UPI0018CAA0A1|nr:MULTISPECIES: hypothetical protein [unclassified Flavobacterium]MBG6111284.1 hypothetical protein [Flavobacterium sp. CG_9.10]MBP2282072.1 hypothetical protein [Flavobacterium sp. CG_23.5]